MHYEQVVCDRVDADGTWTGAVYGHRAVELEGSGRSKGQRKLSANDGGYSSVVEYFTAEQQKENCNYNYYFVFAADGF